MIAVVTRMVLATASRWSILMISFELQETAHGDQQHQGQGEAGVDGAGHEIGGEQGRVPSRELAHGKVPGHDGMDGDHERRGKGREIEIAPAVMPPRPPAPDQPAESSR